LSENEWKKTKVGLSEVDSRDLGHFCSRPPHYFE
jgi:hypothetical protein